MSDLSITLEALQRSRTQLPVTAYFDQALFDKEMRQIFPSAPRYLGHELMVPQVGDYQALAHEGEGRALVRTAQGVELISNVCRHRQAVMLKGAGQLPGGTITCPIHRWAYDSQGKPEEAAVAATRLITQDKVLAVLGEVASSNSLAMAPKASELDDIDAVAMAWSRRPAAPSNT